MTDETQLCGVCMDEVPTEELDVCIYCGKYFCGGCESDMNKCVECKDEGT